MVKIEDIVRIGKDPKIVNGPWGIGDDGLRRNSESWAPYLRFLHALVKEVQPEAVLECGVYMGTATKHMALALQNPESLVVGVDKDFHPDHRNQTDHPQIHTVEGDSTKQSTEQEVEKILDGRKIGVMFIDSAHDGVTPWMEYVRYRKYFADQCIVVCDDLIGPQHLAVKMAIFWDKLPGKKVMLHHLHPAYVEGMDTPGFGVSIINAEA